MKQRAMELLASGEVGRVLGWKTGDLYYDPSPALFSSPAQLEDFTYGGFCAANLSKYLVDQERKPGKTLVFLKPCDTYSFNQLLSEHRISRDKAHIVGAPCDGMLDIRKIKEKGIRAQGHITETGEQITIKSSSDEKNYPRKDFLLEKCISCKSKRHVAYDELLQEAGEEPDSNDRFREVAALEGKKPEERFDFWQNELSGCLRCNACRNVCPVCSCIRCVFDNSRSGVDTKASSDSFEDSMFHIIRAYHVAGRCTDCGECARVCPQQIPLHLLNRKIIKDINLLYGEFTAGETPDAGSPLVNYAVSDAEPDMAGMCKVVK
jgi:ferredoxin